jgi:hypothetical protein
MVRTDTGFHFAAMVENMPFGDRTVFAFPRHDVSTFATSALDRSVPLSAGASLPDVTGSLESHICLDKGLSLGAAPVIENKLDVLSPHPSEAAKSIGGYRSYFSASATTEPGRVRWIGFREPSLMSLDKSNGVTRHDSLPRCGAGGDGRSFATAAHAKTGRVWGLKGRLRAHLGSFPGCRAGAVDAVPGFLLPANYSRLGGLSHE